MDKNQEKNIAFYNNKYRDTEIGGTLNRLGRLDVFLDDATQTDTSWVGFYKNDFRIKIKGKKVLELGCGDCSNAAVMAALGANVFANDIASNSGVMIRKLNEAYDFPVPIKFIEGDFLTVDFIENNFDFVVGKSFLHHLTHPVEEQFFVKISGLLGPTGEARFFEPAVNSKLLDEIRWHIPVPGRPSKFNRKAFNKWVENDPHPERDNSSSHFKKLGKKFFREVEIIPLGALERLHRLIPYSKNPRSFRRKAFKLEKKLPLFFNYIFARSQLIIYREPK